MSIASSAGIRASDWMDASAATIDKRYVSVCVCMGVFEWVLDIQSMSQLIQWLLVSMVTRTLSVTLDSHWLTLTY